MSVSHFTTCKNNVKSPTKEHHEYQARAITIPIEIVECVKDKQITIKEAWLLAIIDALVKCRGEGCWASNEYLANEIQVKSWQLNAYLQSLKSLGLLKSERKNGRRYLETCWSRSVEGEPTKKTRRGEETPCRDLSKNVQEDVENGMDTNTENMYTKCGKPYSTKCGKPYSTKCGNPHTYNKDIDREYSNRVHCPATPEGEHFEQSPRIKNSENGHTPLRDPKPKNSENGHTNGFAAQRINGSSHTNGKINKHSDLPLKSAKPKSKEPIENQLAGEFERIMMEHNRLYKPSAAKNWYKDFASLLYKIPEKEIRKALKDHDEHLEEKWWPKIVTAQEFHLQFQRIKDAQKRIHEDKSEKENQEDEPRRIITKIIYKNGKKLYESRIAKKGE